MKRFREAIGQILIAVTFATGCSCSLAQSAPAPSGSLICERQLARISKQEDVPIEVLFAVGLTESGNKGRMHPYALNIEGKTVFPQNKQEAIRLFDDARNQGKKLIDLGCMQVNYYYHGAQFSGPEDMLVPEKNVTYAARLLKDLKREHGSWTMAVARYHAGASNKKAQKSYVCSVISNLVRTNLGRWTPEAKDYCGKN